MGVLTNLLKLLKPSENDYYNQQTEQADNWDKVDNYAVLTNTDKNGIWGGEYGGKIQDPIPKELNKRYIDNINGKAFICIKAGDSSVTSNTIEYFTPCNVVDNLDKLQNLIQIKPRNYLVGNICFEYFTFSGGAGLYTKSLINNFKEIIFVGFNGLTNEEQVKPEFSQQWLVYSYNEIVSKKAIKLRKMSTQSIEGIVIGIL